MILHETSLKMANEIAEDAIMFGLSEEKEKILKSVMNELSSSGEEIPYNVKKVLGLIQEEEPLQVTDRIAGSYFSLTWVDASLEINIETKKRGDVIQDVFNEILKGTDWEFIKYIEVSKEEEKQSSLIKIGRPTVKIKASALIRNNNEIKGDSEEEVILKTREFYDKEYQTLRSKIEGDFSFSVLSKDTDIVILSE